MRLQRSIYSIRRIQRIVDGTDDHRGPDLDDFIACANATTYAHGIAGQTGQAIAKLMARRARALKGGAVVPSLAEIASTLRMSPTDLEAFGPCGERHVEWPNEGEAITYRCDRPFGHDGAHEQESPRFMFGNWTTQGEQQ